MGWPRQLIAQRRGLRSPGSQQGGQRQHTHTAQSPANPSRTAGELAEMPAEQPPPLQSPPFMLQLAANCSAAVGRRRRNRETLQLNSIQLCTNKFRRKCREEENTLTTLPSSLFYKEIKDLQENDTVTYKHEVPTPAERQQNSTDEAICQQGQGLQFNFLQISRGVSLKSTKYK